MLKLRLTRTAENDLDNIWFYTLTEWGEEQANKYVTLIEKDYRALPVQKHLIFYRIGIEHIEVLGVPHVSMDAKWHFETDSHSANQSLP